MQKHNLNFPDRDLTGLNKSGGRLMEYLTVCNIVTAIVVLLMIGCVVKLFAGDIGSNKTFYLIAFIGLGVGLYMWRSGAVTEVITNIFGIVK